MRLNLVQGREENIEMGKISEHDLESAMAMESNPNLMSSGFTPMDRRPGNPEPVSKFKEPYIADDVVIDDLEMKSPKDNVLTS